MIKKADAQLIKLLNEIQILNLIRERGTISRIELARKTSMSKVAVFEIINRLIEAGFVHDVGKGESSRKGGKRPSLVKLSTENHFVIGIEFKRREALIALANIEATIIQSSRLKYEAESAFDVVIPKVFQKIDSLLKTNSLEKNQLISIGIGIPGLVDYAKGGLHFADTMKGWGNVSITKKFTDRYQVPTILENDVNTITLGESILGAGKDESDLICIWIGEGIGAGLMVGNQLVQGFNGGAGEIGYLELDRYSDASRKLKILYQDQKYYGDILSEAYLCEVLNKILAEETGQDTSSFSIDQLLRQKKYQDLFLPVLNEYSYLLGLLCLNMIKMINPGMLILSGSVVDNSPYILDRVKQVIREGSADIPFSNTILAAGKLSEEAGLRGAIAMALQVIFESEMASAKQERQRKRPG